MPDNRVDDSAQLGAGTQDNWVGADWGIARIGFQETIIGRVALGCECLTCVIQPRYDLGIVKMRSIFVSSNASRSIRSAFKLVEPNPVNSFEP